MRLCARHRQGCASQLSLRESLLSSASAESFCKNTAFMVHVSFIAQDELFRAVFTRCPDDPLVWLLDVRSQNKFKRGHIMSAFCIRATANGETLLDYSQNEYNKPWAKDCWWGKPVIVYGDVGLRKDHSVLAFLIKEGKVGTLMAYSKGFEEFEKQLPFVCTTSVRANAMKQYPGEILPGLLYLGNWDHATDTERLQEIKVNNIITIHNNPENLKPVKGFRHLQIQLADLDTENISKHFSFSFDFIEQARSKGEGVLVHCGAGVSRSATLCMAYLMRRFGWNATKARTHCHDRRSLVNPNHGFWQALCAFEPVLGITDRSNAADFAGGRGADAPVVQLDEAAAGEKLRVHFLHPASSQQPQIKAPEPARAQGDSQKRQRSPERVRDLERGGERRDRDRDRDQLRPDSRKDRNGSRGHAHGEEGDSRSRRRRTRSRDRETGRGRHRDSERGEQRPRSRSDERHSESAAEARDATTALVLKVEDSSAAVAVEVLRQGKTMGHILINQIKPGQRCIFGRQPDCEVVVEHLSVSRQHAHLSTDHSGQLFLTDLGSAHRTNLDGVWIRPNMPRPLKLGSTFRLGASVREYKVVRLPGKPLPT